MAPPLVLMKEGKSEGRKAQRVQTRGECRVAHARGVTAGRGPEPGATGVGGAGDVTGPRVRAVLGSWGSRDPSLPGARRTVPTALLTPAAVQELTGDVVSTTVCRDSAAASPPSEPRGEHGG